MSSSHETFVKANRWFWGVAIVESVIVLIVALVSGGRDQARGQTAFSLFSKHLFLFYQNVGSHSIRCSSVL